MKDATFPKAARLRKRRAFLRVQRAGTKLHTRHFLVLFAQGDPPHGPTRLGVTVTRKVAGAVGRNAIKRRIREAFRRLRCELPPGFDVVVIAKRGPPPSFHDAEAMFRRLRGVLRRQARAQPQATEAGR